ncbi:DUF4864 domain-containing protein [Jannaschia sp. W003]|uniref:DUF4864 domain-containing protein n=1 Tax=Jannaschia sp. W003 TaxID=2867012 RepID=UPI0021A5083F|nr:DUF4864 domain-containing protein [Jannaschia sp. W003]UWQ21642.1 DUF4864 domain-containing protein [Jannaschia sp. W003]
MRHWIAAALLALATPAAADPDAVQGVIDSQIEAFRADDFAEAFTYAAPMIQGMFGSPERFGQMVRQGYPMVWRPGTVEYGRSEGEGRIWAQEVTIVDGAGQPHRLLYRMVRMGGAWRIAGVELLRAPDVAV